MKIFAILILFSLAAFAGPKEDLQNMRNKTNLELTKERLKVIEKDGDLNILHNNILRTHNRLATIMAKHPELTKNKNLKEPELSKLKLKLLNEDEDLRDIKLSLVRMHRKLEAGLMKNSRIKELTEKVESFDSRLKKMK
jgi:hypothetical protein